MFQKVYALVFIVFTQLNCRAQTFSASELLGRWTGSRNSVVAYYDFISDSTYKYWTSNEPDSTRTYRITIYLKANLQLTPAWTSLKDRLKI